MPNIQGIVRPARPGMNVPRVPVQAPSGGRIDGEVAVDGCPPGLSNNAQICSTVWKPSSGILRPVAPFVAPCPGEASDAVLRGRAMLHGIYGDCDFELINTDVPNDDLGVADNLRYLPAVAAQGATDNTLLSGAIAATTTLTKGAGINTAIGIYVRIAYQIALTEAVNVQISTTGALTVAGAVACNRDVTVLMQQGCMVAQFFLPFASKTVGANIWGPNVAVIAASTPTIVVVGPTAGSGTITAQYVGAYSQFLEQIAGSVFNN